MRITTNINNSCPIILIAKVVNWAAQFSATAISIQWLPKAWILPKPPPQGCPHQILSYWILLRNAGSKAKHQQGEVGPESTPPRPALVALLALCYQLETFSPHGIALENPCG